MGLIKDILNHDPYGDSIHPARIKLSEKLPNTFGFLTPNKKIDLTKLLKDPNFKHLSKAEVMAMNEAPKELSLLKGLLADAKYLM